MPNREERNARNTLKDPSASKERRQQAGEFLNNCKNGRASLTNDNNIFFKQRERRIEKEEAFERHLNSNDSCCSLM